MNRRLPILLATAVLIAGPWSHALAAEYPRLSRSCFWQSYAYDGHTIALLHLDEAAAARSLTDLESAAGAETGPREPLEPGLGDGPAPGGAEAAGGRPARNAAPMSAPGALLGDCEFVRDGRFGGALRIRQAGALALKGLSGGSSGARTVEFWLKLEALPDAPRTLALAGAAAGQPLWRLLLERDGTLSLEWNGERTDWPARKVAAGRWTHIALGISTAWPDERAVHFHLDGAPVQPLPVSGESAAKAANVCDALWIGGDRAGRDGVRGWIDEVRVSRVRRAYYAFDLAWPQPARRPPVELKPPYVRDAGDLLFHLGFDGTTAPLKAAPGTAHTVVALSETELEMMPAKVEATFPAGVHGRALMLGEGGIRPSYGAAGNILPPHGTIAFWMRPVDWDNFTRDNRYDSINPTTFGLFQLDCTTVPGSHEAIFHKVYPALQFTVTMHLPEEADDPPPLHPGAWTHVAVTWVGADFVYYVNGRRRDPDGAFHAAIETRTANDPYPYRNAQARWWTESGPVVLRFQENRYWEQRGLAMPRTALDDFRIYSRPLAPSEIANIAALYDPRVKPQPLPVAEMDMAWNGVSGTIRAAVTPLSPDYREMTSVLLSLTRDGAEAPLAQTRGELDALKRAHIVLQAPPLDFAAYTVAARLADAAGAERGRLERTFTRTAPPWWKNRLGVSDKVMAPWTPVLAAADALSVWGRTVQFGGDGLPRSIVSQGRDVLAGPVRLEAVVAGRPAALAPDAAPRVEAVSEVRGEARGAQRAEGFSVRTESYIEFDGMMWFTVTLVPDAGQAPVIDRLTLRIPMAEESSRYIHWWSGRRDFRDPRVVQIGRLPAGEGVLFRSSDDQKVALLAEQRGSFIPYVLLAGEARGMAWFAENDQGWTQSREVPAVSVAREGRAAHLLLSVFSQAVKLDAPRSFSFGLHPIPVRPLDPLWRQYPVYSNVLPDSFSGNNLKGRKGPSTFYLYPEDDWEAVKRRINGEGLTKGAAGLKGLYLGRLKRLADAGIKDPPPQSLTVPGLYWDMQWNGIPPSLEHTREWAETWALNYQYYTPEFVDFCSWAWNDWIEKTDKFVQGAYIDDCWGAPITRAGGPCTYTLPDGHVQPGFQFRGYRERFKRMRQISLDHGVWPHITAHTTHSYFIPYHTFFDLILDGEDHYSSPPAQGDFIDHWPLDRLRFMHNAKWGQVTTWLSWCGNSCPTDKYPAWTFRQTRAYTAGMALHDILWGFDQKVMDEFGLRREDTVFVPYWEDTGLAATGRDDLKVAAWKRPGRCLVLVANVGDKRVEAEVRLSPAAMGFGDAAPDALTVLDRDPTLLTYFDEDVTNLKPPKVVGPGEEPEEPPLDLGERAEDLPQKERRAKDPDGKFAWKDGVLLCPVRRHDYRLFELRVKEGTK